MIIIAENKKNHYLIKKFLIESGIDRDDNNDVQINLRPVSNTQHNSDPRYYVQQDLKPFKPESVSDKKIYTGTEPVLPDDKKFKKLVKKEPKYNVLKNIASKGILTLAMVGLLWNSIPTNNQSYSDGQKSAENQVERELISQNPEEKESILSTFNQIQNNEQEEDLVFSVEYDTSINRDEIKRSIIAFEGFKGLPYPDHHQWSIGHGTKVYSDADITKSQHESLEKIYNRKLSNPVALANWIETQIPGWRQKFLNEYSISSDNKSKFSSINETQAGTAADQSVDYAINAMRSIEYFSVLPKNIKNAYFDMAYNMGPGFLRKFKNFDEAVRHAGIVLNKDSGISEDEAQVAIDLFEIAADEILYNFNEDGSQRGETKYHSDLKKSGRPQKNYNLVKRGIEDIKLIVSPRHFGNQQNNESLKRVYQHLFS